MSAPIPRVPRILLGVTGGIAAYKAVELLRLLTESGHDVRVVPTESALRFVGAATFAALSGHPVHTTVWDDVEAVPHVSLAQSADILVVVPATADFLARAVHGRADDLLSATLLMARCPVVVAPAMHTEMWEHAATRANVATLRERGVLVVEPDAGRLTGADSGAGRLPDPARLADVIASVLDRGPDGAALDLAGRRVVVSSGGTREYLDPVRFLGNRSSGRQGHALARAALVRGAEVVLVAGSTTEPDPAGVKVVHVTSALDMRAAMHEAARDADAVVMAAAVADFRPAARAEQKVKKTDGPPAAIALETNPDILAELVAARPDGQVVVGFAAETEDVLRHGQDKLARKGCDLLVVNEVGDGRGFEVAENAAVVLGADGSVTDVPLATKERLSHVVWDLVVARLS